MPQAKTISAAQARTFIAFLQTKRNTTRNIAAFALSYYAGMRVKEIAALRVSDVQNADGSIKDVVHLSAAQTKGSKGRQVFLNKQAQQYVQAHVRATAAAPEHPLLQPNGKRRHFTANSLCILFRNLYKEAGFDGCTSHTGRRSAISALANKGVGIRVIQRFSGHRSLQSVQPYLDANDDMVRAATELLS